MSGSCIKATLIVGSLLAYLVAIFFNAYLSIPGVSPFNATIGDLSHKYDTGITPTDQTFSIWGLIYTWLLALCVYCNTLLCRRVNSRTEPLYINPGFIPVLFYVSFIISMLGNPGWILVFLLEKLVVASVVLIIGVVTTLVCFMSTVQKLDESGATMSRLGLIADIWCTRIIVHNGIALYLGWISCATLIQIVSTAVYIYFVSMDTACTAALGVLTAVVLGWFVAETFLYDRKLRYVFGQYIAFLAALSGGYAKNYDPQVPYTQYSLGLLIATAAFAAIKITIIVVKTIKDPINYKPEP